MSATSGSTRRSFIRTAALSTPLAAAAAVAPAGAAPEEEPLAARLARLEDAAAIHALAHAYAAHLNAGDLEAAVALFADPAAATLDAEIEAMTADGFGERDTIEIAPDGVTATAVLHCTAQVARAIGPECPLIEMARQQGGGVVRQSVRGVMEHACVRREGVWRIQRAAWRLDPPAGHARPAHSAGGARA